MTVVILQKNLQGSSKKGLANLTGKNLIICVTYLPFLYIRNCKARMQSAAKGQNIFLTRPSPVQKVCLANYNRSKFPYLL